MTKTLQQFKTMTVDPTVRYPEGKASVMFTKGPGDSNDPIVMIQDTSFKYSELEALVEAFKAENHSQCLSDDELESFTAHLCFYEHNGLEEARERYRAILKRLTNILTSNIKAGARGSLLDTHEGMYSIRIHVLASDIASLMRALREFQDDNGDVKYIGVHRDIVHLKGVRPSAALMTFDIRDNSSEREKLSILVDKIHNHITP